MDVSVSSNQRSPEADRFQRADSPRLPARSLDDAFSRHLNETTRRESTSQARGRDQAEARRNERLEEERRAEERQAQARTEEKRTEEQRAQDRAEDKQAAEKRQNEERQEVRRNDENRAAQQAEDAEGAEKAAEKKAAETATQTDKTVASGSSGDDGKTQDPSETAPQEGAGGEETAQKDAEKALAEKAADNDAASGNDAAKPAGNGSTAEGDDTAAADKNAKSEAAQARAEAAAQLKATAKGTDTAAHAAAKAADPATAQNAGTQAPAQAGKSAEGTAQPGTSPAQAAGTGAQTPKDGAEMNTAANNGKDGGAQTGKEGKTLGQQAADKLAARDKGADQATPKPAATANDQPSAPRAQAGGQQAGGQQAAGLQNANLSLAGFGLKGTDMPLNVSFESKGGMQPQMDGIAGSNSGASTQNSNPVMLRFGALPGQSQATQVPGTAIAMQIARHVQKGVNTFEIRIDPPELGRVDVKLDMGADGRVTAHLAVEKSETLDLLQRDSRALQQALKDAGLNADDDTLNFSLQQDDTANTFAEHQQRQEQGGGNLPANGEAGPADEEADSSARYHLTLNGGSGIDIRV